MRFILVCYYSKHLNKIISRQILMEQEKLAIKLEKQEQKELKIKTKEFVKKVFFYDLAKKKISKEIKQELGKLGAYQPFYYDNENERAILYIDMWKSNNKEVKNIVLKEAKKHFQEFNLIDLEILLEKVCQDLLNKRQRAVEMRKGK